MSIRFKLGLILSLAMVAATGCGSLAFLSLQYSSLRESQEQRISLWKASIANIVSESLLARDPLMLYDYLQGIRRSYKEFLRLCVETNGVCQEVGGGKVRLPPRSAARIETVTVPPPPGVRGQPLTVEIWFSREFIAATEREAKVKLGRNIALAGGSVALAGILLSFPLGWTLTRRILRIEKALAHIGAGAASTRIKVQGSDEVARLARDFNEMAAKLQEIDTLKRNLVTAVTHELRSPLGAIESCVKALLAGPARLSAECRENLARVMSNVHRLDHFVTNLLNVAKIERGKLEYAPRLADLTALVENTVLFFQPKAAEARIALACAAEPGLVLRADPDLIIHALTNLLSNALKFTRAGGSVKVEFRRVPGGAECVVTDTGVGLAAEALGRIFRPFERVNNPIHATGVGLGLVISKSILEMHGGRIGVESRLGQGSRFFFFLPENPPAAATPASGPAR